MEKREVWRQEVKKFLLKKKGYSERKEGERKVLAR